MPSKVQQKLPQWMSSAAKVLVTLCYMAWAVQFGGIVACQAYCSNSGPQTVRDSPTSAALPELCFGICHRLSGFASLLVSEDP